MTFGKGLENSQSGKKNEKKLAMKDLYLLRKLLEKNKKKKTSSKP
jgi:hypothetical protein